IIPPSIPMILFAVSTDTSTGELFIAGVVPGILIGGALMLYVWLYAKRHGLGKMDGDGRLPLWQAFKRAWLALLMPVIILGGIYGGVFTPTEASVVDRKSTRLNSSHVKISYAVFCLKKKKTKISRNIA